LLTFLIDSREQLPFRFGPPRRKDFASAITRTITLREGDYAVAIDDGEPLSIRLERKSLSDLFGVIGYGRERFERELERLAQYQYRAIVIEGTLLDVLRGAEYSRVHPASAIGSLCAWSIRFGVHVWYGHDHVNATKIAQRLLEIAAVDELRRRECQLQ
jgi:DNA excision repair protein ERCC-4